MNLQDELVQQILDHLNGEIAESALIQWAENAFIRLSESDEDTPNEAVLLEILGYIGAADTPGFALTWATLSAFLDRLQVKVKIIAEA